ncbi:MAG: PAS domain S-box protein [Candidatus Aminicenantales bacterium]
MTSQCKRAEEALRESESKYRFLVDNSKEVILILNKKGKIVFANRNTLTAYGYSEEEVIGKFITHFLTKDSIQKALNALAQEWAGRPHPEIEVRAKTKFGEVRYLKFARGSVPLYKKGRLTGVMVSATDITEHKKAEDQLRESQKYFRELWDNAPIAYHTLNKEGIIASVNQTEAKMLGYSKEEMVGRLIFEFIWPPHRMEARKRFRQKISGRLIPKVENRIYIKKDGSKIYVDISDVLERDGDDQVIGIWTTMTDITKRKEVEAALKISEERYKDLVEKAGIAIFTNDTAGNFTYVNERFAQIFGYSMEEMKRQSIHTIVHSEDRERVLNYYEERLHGKDTPSRYEYKGVRKDGSLIHLEVDTAISREGKNRIGTRSYLWDITERKQGEGLIRASLREKDVLLREIHHRVNNNMQIVLSLLNFQSRYIHEDQILEIFREVKNRIRSMALVHEKLYKSKDLSTIEFSEYIRGLVIHLFNSYKVDSSLIRPRMDLEEVYLDINTAIPCGLIVNELVSNALKYAFPVRRSGEIGIELHRMEKDKFLLTVSDNGIGLPEKFHFNNPETLGMQIVTMLVDQLEGHIEVRRQEGTLIQIFFGELKYKSLAQIA